MINFLHELRIFSKLTKENIGELSNRVFVEHLQAESLICKEGEVGNFGFILLQGSVDVIKDGKVVHRLETVGEMFGEVALDEPPQGQEDKKRVATLVTGKPTVLALISK